MEGGEGGCPEFKKMSSLVVVVVCIGEARGRCVAWPCQSKCERPSAHGACTAPSAGPFICKICASRPRPLARIRDGESDPAV